MVIPRPWAGCRCWSCSTANGADEHDLFGLVPYLPEGIAVASVAAPLAPPWPMPGRSWYPIEGLDGRSSAAVTLAAESFLRWLDTAATEAPSIALLGFSQGAAVSLQACGWHPSGSARWWR